MLFHVITLTACCAIKAFQDLTGEMGSYGREQPRVLGFNHIHKTTGERLEDERLPVNFTMKSTEGGVSAIRR